jgi:hypothetical protein
MHYLTIHIILSLEGAAVIPDKHYCTRIAAFGFCQLPLHRRYTRMGAFFRWGMAVAYSRYKFLTVTVSLLKRLCNGHFNSKTAAWIQGPLNTPAWTSKKPGKSVKAGMAIEMRENNPGPGSPLE